MSRADIVPVVKIYGERNTGTTYLAHLLSRNLKVEILPGVVPQYVENLAKAARRAGRALGAKDWRLHERIKDIWFATTFGSNLGWKHGLVRPDIERFPLAHSVTFVTLTKNPYSWLLSLYRRPYHHAEPSSSFAGFLQAPWVTVWRESAAHVISSPVELWNLKNAAYLRLSKGFSCVNLGYEDTIRDPRSVVESIRLETQCEVATDTFANVEESTKDQTKRFADYRSYYLGEEWRHRVTPADIRIINDRLDEETAQAFGYRLL